MKLYIDNATNSLVTSSTNTATPTITLFKEDISSVEIRFVENGSVVDIGTPTIRLALGKNGSLIAFTESWTKNGTGASAKWTGAFNLNTQQAEIVLAGLTSTDTILEVEVRQGAEVATKAQISVTLKTDLINETDLATDIGNIVSVGGDHIASTTNVHGIANTANLVLTNDARLSDTRDPKAHTHAPSEITGTAVVTNDSRLSDPRTPTAHKSTHATGGADALTPSDIGAQPSGSYAPSTGISPSAITGTAVVTADSRLSDSRTPTSHTHGNITNDGKVLVPYGGILSATNVDSPSNGTFPLIQGGASGGVITVLNGVISVTSAGTGYVNTVDTSTYARTGGGSRFVLITQSTQNAPANLPVITTTGGAITAGYLPDSRQLVIACSDEASNLTVGTDKVTFRSPYAFTLTGVRASVNLAPTGSAITVDINKNGTSVLSTKLSIDATQKTSLTSASPAVISDSSIANDSEITIDIDQIGSAIAGRGLKVVLIGQA
jgi:hypothetical protein